jgi:hypothetical protein
MNVAASSFEAFSKCAIGAPDGSWNASPARRV